ncbi:NAD(P)-binding protein [Lepidopterella palustris CBS 459.81]|uniref:NAD(P)-binding protein n=1 Tax=Lepidopterella palustris CBS 459.81 TaxID=1314670 RepID=A0A8E2JAH1_9PEZI|nr:NAD(P)-binding protein [Lepidopterella palustris CBS 459.81]
MSSKKVLTIFGVTSNQGSSIINLVLARPDLAAKFSLRGITRSLTSDNSQTLTSKGIELREAQLDNVILLKAAIRGLYGMFGGKNIFEASKAENVTYLVFSSLPYAEKVSSSTLKHILYFNSKATSVDGTPTLALPFAENDAWPLIDPRRDSGKYVMALFEGGTTRKEVVNSLSKEPGKTVRVKQLLAEVFAGFLLEKLIGDYSYYGKGEREKQAESDKWLVKDANLITCPKWAHENGLWTF